jgi:hypothetical protein
MHNVDGYNLEFTSRKSWRARLYVKSKCIDEIAVGWARNMFPVDGVKMLSLHLKSSEECQLRMKSAAPFKVAIALQRNPEVNKVIAISGVFEVLPISMNTAEHRLENRVLRRLHAANEAIGEKT